ncbi:hypothetical protein SCHPADRAFT_1002353 [Schizopora paradoxa]|uniref:Uncharacterized protein n=1 Tax=Schizopora paradoxa TaxID=27342 RepID=A0A0H2RNP3_9AGAM|nr:hypothetical protein SCHPADRAFT_1002353 [Schizopora paradoxa]
MSYNYFIPISRTDTQSTDSTNATAPNLPGPGRNLGRLLDSVGKRLEFFLSKCATRFGIDPVAVAREIRLLRRTEELTIAERYSQSSCQLSNREVKILKKLCEKLMKLAGSRVISTQLDALEELTSLAIEDSLIRRILAGCERGYLEPKFLEPELLLASAKALASVKEAETHELWSSVLLRPDMNMLDPKLEESIKSSLLDPNTSFIAARHLSNIVLSSKWEVTRAMTGNYILTASKTWWNIEWLNFCKCLSIVMQSAHGHAAVGIQLNILLVWDRENRVNVAKEMIREWRLFSNIFNVLCSVPHIELIAGNDPSDFETSFVGVTNWNLDACAKFVVAFLSTLSGSDSFVEQVMFIQHLDTATHRLLEGTALLDELCIAYCHLRRFHAENSSAIPVLSNSYKYIGPISALAKALEEYMYRSLTLKFDSNLNFSTSSPHRRSLAAFIAVKFGSVNRYCKLAMSCDKGRILKPFLFSHDIAKKVNNSTYIEWPTSEPLPKDAIWGEREHCMIRWVVGGVCRYIVRDPFSHQFSGFGRASEIIFHKYSNQEIRVDILLYHDLDTLLVHVEKDDIFNASGHFPILTGFDESGHALYFAHSSNFDTCVADGSSNAVFKSNYGFTSSSDTFSVPVLRWDPSYFSAHPKICREGAIDPTGPLHWLELWPMETPHFRTIAGKNEFKYLETWLLPLLKKQADAVVRRSTQFKRHKKGKPGAETRNSVDTYLRISSTEALNDFRALPFAENRSLTPFSMNEGEFVNADSYSLQANAIVLKDGESEDDVEYLKEKIRRLEEKNSWLEAELRDARC